MTRIVDANIENNAACSLPVRVFTHWTRSCRPPAAAEIVLVGWGAALRYWPHMYGIPGLEAAKDRPRRLRWDDCLQIGLPFWPALQIGCVGWEADLVWCARENTLRRCRPIPAGAALDPLQQPHQDISEPPTAG